MSAESPYLVVHINDTWSSLKGMSQSKAEAQTFSQIVRLPDSQMELLDATLVDASYGRAGSVVVRAQDGESSPLNYIKVTMIPCSDLMICSVSNLNHVAGPSSR